MAHADISTPARGAYIALADLIALRFPARQLSLGRQSRALSHLAGPNKTNFRGRGVDFEEVRSYQPGDDIRTIDWRVTARTGEAHTKLFREERERPVLVVVDQRNCMFFGSRHCFKSVLAAQLGALIAWSALKDNDRVGGLVFSDHGHQDIRPRRSRATVLSLLSSIVRYNTALPRADAQPHNDFTATLANLRRIARPGSSVFLVSDFRGAWEDAAREQLFELGKHTEITALACSDPLEATLPREGSYAVTDGVERSELDTGDRALRARFADLQQRRQAIIAEDLLKLGIPLLQASTESAPLRLLSRYYAEQRR